MLDTFWRDLRHAGRSLRRSPGFAAAAVLTVALGVGANTAIFSVVNGVLLRPLPYPEPDRIVRVWNAWDDATHGRVSPAEYFDYLDRVSSFEHFGVYAFGFSAFTGSGEPERLQTGYVTPGVLPALGASLQLGRLFASNEFSTNVEVPDAPVAIITDGLWRGRFGSAGDIIGREVVLDNRARTIVGVLEPGFRLPDDFDSPEPIELFVPLGFDRARVPRGSHFLLAVARLRPSVSHEQASAELRGVAERFTLEHPDNYPAAMGFTARTVPLHEDVVGDVRPILLTLLGAIGFVLLIACGNITHLFLSRGEQRREEFAIRAALGAGSGRLIAQTLVESTLVACAGGAAGLVLAFGATRALIAMSPPDLPRLDAVRVDTAVLAFALGASLAVGMLVGVVPALRNVLGREGTAADARRVAGAAPARQRLRRALVASQVAIAIVLTLGAGLMVNSLLRLLAVDPGYRTDGVLTASIDLPEQGYENAEEVTTFFVRLIDRLRTQPGVRSAGAVSGLPLSQALGDLNFQIEGRETAPGQRSRRADWQAVTPGYFETIGMRVLQGRVIEDTDRVDTPGVVVINESAARMHWPAGDAIGKRMTLGGRAGPGQVTVIGIVNDVRHATLRAEPRPEMYLAHTQFRFWGLGTEPVRAMRVVLRADGNPVALTATLRREVAALDPRLPVAAIRTMESVRSASIASVRFVSVLLAIFAAVALAVTLVGVYGVMAYSVARRQREIGVRVALGAAPHAVVTLILGQGLRPAVIGIATGIAAGMLLTRALQNQLYGVSPHDAATAATVGTLVALVAFAACYIPAARAAHIDPSAALRAE